MNYSHLYLQIALSELRGIGLKRCKILLEHLADVEDVFTLSLRELYLQTGIGLSTLSKMDRDGALRSAENIMAQCEKMEITPIFYTHPTFSARLRECEDAPLVVYTKGDFDLNQSRLVAVVGTRAPSNDGYKHCEELISGLQDSNVIIVSGLAYGIDITAHKMALEVGLPTIGVLAHGLERIYPTHHKKIANEMLKNGGLITEFPPFANVERENFPMRNRIVAGMCDATIVVESKSKGGSLITAELANDYSRDVFAFPGSIYNELAAGCNDLIAEQKAMLLRGPIDFLLKMGWQSKKSISKKQLSLFDHLSEEERLLLNVLNQTSDIHIDSIADQLSFSISDVNVILFQLEMEGLIKPLPGNRYQMA